jgi:hypothetical protein
MEDMHLCMAQVQVHHLVILRSRVYPVTGRWL